MNKDEKVIKEIIRRYGNVIDLKKSPYLITEIIRNYSGLIDLPMANENPCGGTPPVPGKLPNPTDIDKEISNISNSLQKLHKKVNKLLPK